MSERDKELWGMLWRFGLVLAITGFTMKAAQAVLLAVHANLIISFVVINAIWLLPCYLAYRARQQNED